MILGITLLLNWTTFSQTDTSKVCFSYDIAKSIAIDLTQGDSAKAELKQTHLLLKITQDKVISQDSLISTLDEKIILDRIEIKIHEEKEVVYREEVQALKENNEKLIRKNNRLKTTSQILGGGFIGTLAVIFTFIALK